MTALRHRGGVVNGTTAITAAKGLTQSSSDPDLNESKSIPHGLKAFSGKWDLLEGWQQRLKYQYLTKPTKKMNWFLCIR